jgi:hypothetical protein
MTASIPKGVDRRQGRQTPARKQRTSLGSLSPGRIHCANRPYRPHSKGNSVDSGAGPLWNVDNKSTVPIPLTITVARPVLRPTVSSRWGRILNRLALCTAKASAMASSFQGSNLFPKLPFLSVHLARKSRAQDGVEVSPTSFLPRKTTAREAKLLAIL